VSSFTNSFKQSSLIFDKYFKDKLIALLGGDIEIVESITTNDMADKLDKLAGIDLWYYDEHGIYGIASRIQFGRCYETFTIRKERESGVKTEYEKRKYAIENDLLYPKLTFQGYFDLNNNIVEGFAIAKTKDIIWMIDNNYCRQKQTRPNQKGQASFYIVSWHDMLNKKLDIYIYKRAKKKQA